MGSNFSILLNGQAADDTLKQLIASTEVEESLDMPAAIQLKLPVSRSSGGDLTYISDARFAPMATIAVVAQAGGSGAGGVAAGAAGAVGAAMGSPSASPTKQCIFDGYVLTQKIHLETGTTNSALSVWGQDASWLMNQAEKAREWVDVTDSSVAASIFGDYGITPSDQNSNDDSPSHTEDTHSLMQRGSDIAFLRMLARRGGKVCRIACADTPGNRTGYFAVPQLTGDPVLNLALNDPDNWTINSIDLEWDATRPTNISASSALFSDPSQQGATGDSADSGLAALGARNLAAFTSQTMTVLLAAIVDSGGELTQRAQAVLRETGWFLRCEGEADAERLGVVLRPGMLVKLVGIGDVHSGNWIVWTVRHKITEEKHTMRFTLLRNAAGDPPATSGGLSSLVGAV